MLPPSPILDRVKTKVFRSFSPLGYLGKGTITVLINYVKNYWWGGGGGGKSQNSLKLCIFKQFNVTMRHPSAYMLARWRSSHNNHQGSA